MHEMSLCEGILQILEEQAAAQGYSKVKTVWLEVGSFAGVEIEALRFCFDVVCKNTLADQARLEILEIPASSWCMSCAKTVTLDSRHAPCPLCGGYQLQSGGGDELRVKELEVE
ncbi:MAG: hydrogenase maturation nickel metallochaperone HypA [Gammaproteobacteria bacterium]|nr:hydrogenase maturation nickel metallochaperone HypA [Gammaproteobacteria bacterium]